MRGKSILALTCGFALAVVYTLLLSGCSGEAPGRKKQEEAGKGGPEESEGKGVRLPGTEQGARALLERFSKPDADCAALTAELRPSKTDYEAAFKGEAASKVRSAEAPIWESGSIAISPPEGESKLSVFSATAEELTIGMGSASRFREGYGKVGEMLNPGTEVYGCEFKAAEGGEGKSFYGLIHVNRAWRYFPKAQAAFK